ncbi:MAG: DUF4159 domain-containing protein [Candidatus Latescibacteria bacterium]|nr:DUF4159 domain-containing protein [Candidatus Latescibacterota bacterium]
MENRYGVLISKPRWLLIGLVLSAGVHFFLLGGYLALEERVREVVHRITFEPPPPPSMFYKAPRTTARALEFRKQPVPRGAYQRQQTKVAKTRVQEVQAMAALRTQALLSRLDAAKVAPPSLRGQARLGVGGGLSGRAGEGGVGALPLPQLSRVDVKGVKETSEQVDMTLDMLSIRDMDTGQYTAMVVQDPDDRRKISGYIYLAQAFTRSRALPQVEGHESGSAQVLTSQVTEYQSLDFLIKSLDEYTGIEGTYMGPVPLDDPRLLQVPWLLLPNWFGEPHSSNEGELENLGRYLMAGGFAIVRSGPNEKMKGVLFDKLRQALKAQGLNEGADWRFTYLKPSHPVYHSFFDFDMAVRDNQKLRAHVGDMGLVMGDRLAVFISGAREIVTSSARVGTGNFQVTVDGRRHLQFTINTIVFALTQEGGVTQQLMARVK